MYKSLFTTKIKMNKMLEKENLMGFFQLNVYFSENDGNFPNFNTLAQVPKILTTLNDKMKLRGSTDTFPALMKYRYYFPYKFLTSPSHITCI